MHAAHRPVPSDASVAPQVRAAGGVVWRRRPDNAEDGSGAGGGPDTVEVLLVHRPRYDDWSLPKGKLEPGETDEQAALREVEEETGLRCVLDRELPSVRYIDRDGRDKLVRFWAMEPVGESPWRPDDEVDVRRWVAVSDAPDLLTYAGDHEVLAALEPASSVSPPTPPDPAR